ncbi:MAG: fibronectin type III domain-containing protein [Chromatiales bacterium]|jgi:hypothetical protein
MTDLKQIFWVKQHWREAVAALMLLFAVAVNANEVALQASPQLSTDGAVRLDWSVPGGAVAQIQRAPTADFASPLGVYQGTDTSAVITGLTDGQYLFRGRLQFDDGRASAWSEPLQVTVEHHSLTRAQLFFLVGAIVFVSTALLIVTGARRGDGG